MLNAFTFKTGVDSYILTCKWGLELEWVKVTQLCQTLWDPMDYTVHGILQSRILEWVAFPFSRGSSQPGIKPRSALQADSLPAEPPGKHLRIFQRACSNSDSWAVPSGSLTQPVRELNSHLPLPLPPIPPPLLSPQLITLCDLPTVCSWPWASVITQVR